MNKNFYEYLCCPYCKTSLELLIIKEDSVGIKKGNLKCNKCLRIYPIIKYIPRFVKKENYASSFGYEWNKYSNLRSDRYNRTNIIRNTILTRSGWNKNHLKGKLLLECGCGAGNDTEVLLNLGAKVISFDYSNSVESALENNKDQNDILIIQANIYNIPLKEEICDVVFCHRVIQHTPDPEKAFYSIIKYIKKNGEIFLHSYDRNYHSMFHYKYLLRPITKRMDYKTVFIILEKIGPILYPFVGKIKRYKNLLLNFIILRLIPFDNYDSELEKKNAKLTNKEKYEYSLLNVLDALTPKYDNPSSAKTVIKWFEKANFTKIKLRQRNPVIVLSSWN